MTRLNRLEQATRTDITSLILFAFVIGMIASVFYWYPMPVNGSVLIINN